MKIRPGKRLLGLIGVLAAWSLVCFVWPVLGWLIPVALIATFGAAAREFLILSRGFRQITIRRTLPTPVPRGRFFEIALEIENRSPHAWSAEVRDEFPATAEPKLWLTAAAMPAGRLTKLFTSLRISVRGRFTFGPVWIRLHGPWGLLEAQKTFGMPQALQVYPESMRSQEELAKDAADELRLLDRLRFSRHRGVGAEFESLEEFRFGDDPRRIDWRASARTRRPVVRRYQIERHRDLMVLVDCGRLMGADAKQGSKLDCAVDAALRLLRLASRGGDRCGLGIFDDQVLGFLRPIGGNAALPTFLASLYDVQSRWRESDFAAMFATVQARQTKRALIVVLSDVVDVETSGRFRTSLQKLAQRHLVLFAALQTPLLREFIEAPLKSLEDGFKKAVAFRILRERSQALHELRRGGVHVLDVEPAQLTAPLINQFIELRGSSLM
jgi:uncharacterized protein (DUF58 family)